MAKFAASVAVLAAVVTVLGSNAIAGQKTNDLPKPTLKKIGGAQAPNARLAVFVLQGSFVARSKGVAAVTNPSVGLYCIAPSGDLNVSKIIPTVTVDWSNSYGNSLTAYWRSSGVGCPEGQIAIVTYARSDTVLTNDVAFTVVVP